MAEFLWFIYQFWRVETTFVSAVVCYAANRNELRSRVIQWLQTEVVPDGWLAKGSHLSDILLKYFKVGFFLTSETWVRLYQTQRSLCANYR